MASCLGKGLYEVQTLASPGLLDFFTYAPAHERPWQLKLDNGVGAGHSVLLSSQRAEMAWGLGSGLLKGSLHINHGSDHTQLSGLL